MTRGLQGPNSGCLRSDGLMADQENANPKNNGRRATALSISVCGYIELFIEKQNATILNTISAYLNVVRERIIANGGFVTESRTDGFTACFTPEDDSDNHAIKALVCAAEIHKACAKLSSERFDRDSPQLQVQAGIATGDIVLGSIESGTNERLGALGPAVLKANRLQPAAKLGGTLINSETYSIGLHKFPCRLIRRIRLHGYDEFQKAYEILNAKETQLVQDLGHEKRKFARLELNIPVAMQVGQWSHQGRAQNMSAGGILVVSKEQFQSDTPVVITAIIPLARAELPLKIEGRIVHCRPEKEDMYALGIQFTRLISESREALEHILSAILGTTGPDFAIGASTDSYGRESFSYDSTAKLEDTPKEES